MWCCVDLTGTVLEVFAAHEWGRAVRWAERHGGDLELLWLLNAVKGEQAL